MKKVNWTYVDMDGVIADFFKALALEFGVNHWKDIPTQEDVIQRLSGTDFFSRIPIFPTTIKFLHMVERYTKGRWSILSTPLKGDEENSSKHKDIWLDNLFGYAFDNDFNKKLLNSLVFFISFFTSAKICKFLSKFFLHSVSCFLYLFVCCSTLFAKEITLVFF